MADRAPVPIQEQRVACPACGADVFATVEAAGVGMVAGEYVVEVRVTALSGCPHVNGWRPDPDGGLPVTAAA